MAECPSCGAGLETPLCCDACGVLLAPGVEPDPFEVLGLPRSYEVDEKDLKARLLRFSRRVHPDFFATAPEEQRQLAEGNTAILNRAYATLADDFRRGDHLVKSAGGPSEKDEREMPQAFLVEVLEWNETLEAVREAPPGAAGEADRAGLAELETSLQAEREDAFTALASALVPLPESGAEALVDARKRLNAIRYIDRTLGEIRDMRLQQAATR